MFESIWSFESTSGVRISTVRIVPTPLFKVVTPLSPHRSSLRNEIVNQSELYLYSLKKAADVYANQNAYTHDNIDTRPNLETSTMSPQIPSKGYDIIGVMDAVTRLVTEVCRGRTGETMYQFFGLVPPPGGWCFSCHLFTN